jgi:predicted MFS family arabinose efflux permease
VLGMSKALAWAGIPLGSLLGGFSATALGLTTALVVFGVAMLLTTLAPFVFPSWRQLDAPRQA